MRVTLEMNTAWHVGTGIGRSRSSDDGLAPTDAEQYRSGDVAGVPGSHFKGLVKDAARMVLAVYGEDREDLRESFDRVFGASGRDDLTGWDFSDELRVAAADAEPQVSTHNRIDPRSGRVPKGALHDREVVPATTLTCTLTPPTDASDLDRALVTASVLALEAIGAKRSRGFGECRPSVDLDEAELRELLVALAGEQIHD